MTEEQNPIKKLMEGFCSPRKISVAPSYDDEMEEEVSDKYAPDLDPQTPKKESPDDSTASPEPSEIKEEEEEAPVETPESTTDETDPATTDEKPADADADAETKPEVEVSKKMVENRQKRGIENFVMACIFLLATLLALNKLGYTTSVFDLSDAGAKGSGSIHIFEKPAAVEEQEPVVEVEETSSEEEVISDEEEVTVDEL